MKIIVCLDDDYGMLFNDRRQSMDSALRERIAQITKGSVLLMNSYSARQFSDFPGNMVVDECFLDKAEGNGYYFVENTDITPYAPKISTLIIYRWNRNYPQDVSFPVSLLCDKQNLVSVYNFEGHSHNCITEEVYSL